MSLLPPLIALVLQWSLWSAIRPYVWFLFYPAVFASSWFGGRWAGIHSTLVSTLLVWYLFIAPEYQFTKGPHAPLLPAAVFLTMGAVFSLSHERLRRSEQRSRELFDLSSAVFDSTSEGIIVTDAEARIVRVNQAFTAITGFSADEVLGKTPAVQRSGLQDQHFYSQLWSTLKDTGQWQGELWNRRKSGELFPVWESISAIRGATGGITGYVSILTDITKLKQAEERLRHLANHDPLTELPNRLLFASSMQQSIERAKRHRERVALIFIDLDRFKLVNDSMGHAAGDKLLKEVGRRLKRTVRAEDVVCRLGGDEFTVVVEEIVRVDDVAALAQKIIASLSTPVTIDGRQLVVSASLGIALYPDDAQSVEELSRAADAAMYRAKERGRSTFEFYTTEISDSVHEQLSMEVDLRAALEREELALHFQPQFDPMTMKLKGVEALLRWRHPMLGLLMPDRFIQMAEQTHLINALGTWVLQRACAQLRAWVDEGFEPVRMAINVSGRQVIYDHLVSSVESALEQYALQDIADCIELELTESVLQAVGPSTEVLDRMRAMGVRVAIDDFGVGYSSLGLLRHLPIDALKIDRSFVRNLPADENSDAIVQAVISMAHALGLKVVAEGVETEAQLDRLRALACDEVQGFLLGVPMPASEIRKLLSKADATLRAAGRSSG
ncbi:EAL domain-containing protein [Paucibacter sp. O1-1]|nr:EAL domain-containing protein [Paucibacter sp. O1-1]MDA3827477.1 EAL domain-containing protein [Paucibacter sp. O1-1]